MVQQQEDVLTFIVPVRHPANAKDWPQLKSNLTQTARSIARQTDPRWRGVVVANHGADLPTLPERFSITRVDFPPNPLHEIGAAKLEEVYESFRLDKGRRVLAGLVAAKPQGHVMIVDDDDLISRRLTEFVSHHRSANGWFVQDGYIWSAGGRLVYRYRDFSHLCGTSHIIRNDLYAIPQTVEGASERYIRRFLGSHRFIQDELKESGTPLEPLPFLGAVYRVGHPGAHSHSTGVLQKYFHKSLVKRPKELLRRASRLRWMTPRLQQEFFGKSA